MRKLILVYAKTNLLEVVILVLSMYYYEKRTKL